MHRDTPDEIEGLGSLQMECAYNSQSFTKTAILSLAMMLAGLGFALVGLFGLPVQQAPDPDAVPRSTITAILCALGAFLVIGAAIYLWWENRWRDMKLQIHQGGLVYTAGGQTEVCRWDQISEVVWDDSPSRVSFYRLELKDKRSLAFNSIYFRKEDIQQLGAILGHLTKGHTTSLKWRHFE